MPSTDRLLSELEKSRYRFGRAEAARILHRLRKARAARFDDVASLIRFHEVLLALRAFPPGPGVLRASVQLLDSFWKRVERSRDGRRHGRVRPSRSFWNSRYGHA